jgi:hypothetical protein
MVQDFDTSELYRTNHTATTHTSTADSPLNIVVVSSSDTANGHSSNSSTTTLPFPTEKIDQQNTEPLHATRKRRTAGNPSYVDTESIVTKKFPKQSSQKEVEAEFEATWICVECKEAECPIQPDATDLLICDGVCQRVFHYPCAGLNQLPNANEDFICTDCVSHKHICSICSNYGYDDEDVYKCNKKNCGLFFHESCLSMQNIDMMVVVETHTNSQNNQNMKNPVSTTNGMLNRKRRFVCPAHSCWTCTQIDLKEQEIMNHHEAAADNTTTTSTKRPKKSKKKNVKISSVFESKNPAFLTVRCILYYIHP